jgi:hypothetical protein
MYAGNPLLFPMVSFNHLPGSEHHYEWNGVRYTLPQHRMKWRTVGTTGNSLLMELSETPETLKVYPFRFACQVKYELRNGTLIFISGSKTVVASRCLSARASTRYFKIPFTSTGSRDACYVEFSSAGCVQTSERMENLGH